jgi:hypothetical protein
MVYKLVTDFDVIVIDVKKSCILLLICEISTISDQFWGLSIRGGSKNRQVHCLTEEHRGHVAVAWGRASCPICSSVPCNQRTYMTYICRLTNIYLYSLVVMNIVYYIHGHYIPRGFCQSHLYICRFEPTNIL